MYLARSFMSDKKGQKHQQPLILVVENHDDELCS